MAAKKAVKEAFTQKGTGQTVLIDVNEKLAFHLKTAEEHLIAAVELFGMQNKPDRHPDYLARLTRAQELVTWLFREELIRIRGPIKVTVSKRK